jgi:DNA modification methylase
MELPVNEIEFSSDTTHRKQWFRGCSFSHPAKLHLSLQMYLIEHYTKPGDTILDPMAGSGTVLVACALGRHVIAVELEQKFVDMQQANWEKIKSLGAMLGFTMGQATIIQGDARQLDNVLADCAIFSPPYAEQKGKGFTKKQIQKAGLIQRRTYTNKSFTGDTNCGNTNGQISNLPYGSISAVISSPPHGNRLSDDVCKDKDPQRMSYRQALSKVDTIVTSPPYGLGEGLGHSEKTPSKLRKEKYRSTTYTDKVDVVCTSPSYEADNANLKSRKDKSAQSILKTTGMRGEVLSTENIGNLKSDNYLSAMASVYSQCYKVLKDNGLMILVTKNFIRNKAIVRLDLDTIKLCEQSGFCLIERLKRKLTQQSFWRRIALMKCDNRKSKNKCKLGFKCPVKIDDQMFNELFTTKKPEEIFAKCQQIIEKLCPKFINTMPKIEFEDVLIFQKIGLFDNGL